jgi:hypothetical protein
MILDADGDEVMSGPGFEHAVVKVLPPGLLEEPPDPAPALDAFDPVAADVVRGAIDEAAFHGHPWVGNEHLALALSQQPDVAAALGREASLDALDTALAHFCEGPWADDRLAIVRTRRARAAFVRQPPTAFSWTFALSKTLAGATRRAAERAPGLHEVVAELYLQEHSLPIILLEQAGADVDEIKRRAAAFR